MNAVFISVFAALLIFTGLLDLQKIKKLKKSMRRLHLLLYAATIGMFVCLAMDIDVPMPTELCVDVISPWVFRLIHPS